MQKVLDVNILIEDGKKWAEVHFVKEATFVKMPLNLLLHAAEIASAQASAMGDISTLHIVGDKNDKDSTPKERTLEEEPFSPRVS